MIFEMVTIDQENKIRYLYFLPIFIILWCFVYLLVFGDDQKFRQFGYIVEDKDAVF